MVVVQAVQLDLLRSSPSLSSPEISSLLFDPDSLSLALMHSDSSFSLYPSFSPFSLSSPSLPPPQFFIPSPSSSATFFRIQHSNPSPNYPPPRLLFLVSSPLMGGSAVLLRFYILLQKSQSFTRARVLCNGSDLKFDDRRYGVVFNVSHGVSVKLAGSINVFAMYSVSRCKIWVFAMKFLEAEEDDVTVKLMKCATIDCCVPVFSISVSFGFLILGEENGVRVFPLRPLVKGRVKKHGRVSKNPNDGLDNGELEAQKLRLPNGLINAINASDDFNRDPATNANHVVRGHVGKSIGDEGAVVMPFSCRLDGKMEKRSNYAKLKSVKLRQDSREGGACFVAFRSKEFECLNSTRIALKSTKAVSVQAFAPNKFLVLDSAGELYLFHVSTPVLGSEISCRMKHLTQSMKIEKLAVLPDISTRAQALWMSDGQHTIHVMLASDMETVNESDGNDSEEKNMQASVIQAIFASGKIQDIVAFAANAILVLGQGSIFTYAIS